MKYERERRVKVYVRKTAVWHKLGCEGRTVLWHLNCEANLIGHAEVQPGEDVPALAKRLDMPDALFTTGLARLFELDVVRWLPKGENATKPGACLADVANAEGGEVVIVEFVAEQAAKKSNALLSWEKRERRRLAKLAMKTSVRPALMAKLDRVTVQQAKELGLLTRTQTAHALGMSLATLRRREGKSITPVLSELGEHLFRSSEVEALAVAMREAAKPPPEPHREPPAAPVESPIWAKRAERLAAHMANKQQYSTPEMLVIGKRVGLKVSDTEETLIARDGFEFRKVEGKWIVNKGEKP